MAKKILTKDTNTYNAISGLADQPNLNDGLTSAQLKAKFDEAGNEIKTFVNDTLITELQSSAANSSGAQGVGYDGSDIDNVADALDQIYSAGSGTIPPDGTITQAKLDVPLNAFVDDFTVNVNTEVDTRLASQAEAEAGTDNTKVMTPLRVAQYGDRYRKIIGLRNAQNTSEATALAVFTGTIADDFGNIEASTPTKLTVPAGVTRVKISAFGGLSYQSFGSASLTLLKNGVSVGTLTPVGSASTNTISATGIFVLTVVTGDYFQIEQFGSSGDIGQCKTVAFLMEVLEY